MNPSFREILELLNKHQVEYVVIGGVAAVLHGAPVTTFNLDELVRQKRATNRAKDRAIIEVLEEVLRRQKGDK